MISLKRRDLILFEKKNKKKFINEKEQSIRAANKVSTLAVDRVEQSKVCVAKPCSIWILFFSLSISMDSKQHRWNCFVQHSPSTIASYVCLRRQQNKRDRQMMLVKTEQEDERKPKKTKQQKNMLNNIKW